MVMRSKAVAMAKENDKNLDNAISYLLLYNSFVLCWHVNLSNMIKFLWGRGLNFTFLYGMFYLAFKIHFNFYLVVGLGLGVR